MTTALAWGEIAEDGCKTFELHDAQADILQHPARFKAAIAGTGGGKTVLGPVWIAAQILNLVEQGRRDILGFVVAPTYQVLARATAKALVDAFAGSDLQGRYVPTMNRYYLPHDLGVIWLLSADHPQALEGGQADFVWIDEAGQIKYEAWLALVGRTGQKQAPILITTTPYGMNWLYTHFYKRFLAGDADYYVRQWASNENPAYSTAEYERAMATMTAQRAAMRYQGQFVRLSGLVYPDLADCFVEHFTPPDGTKVGGIDFGWQNPFVALAATLYVNEYGDDMLYVHYERFKSQVGLEAHAEALPKGYLWFADPSEPEMINRLRRAGHRVRGAENAIIIGVDAVNSRICTRRLVISDRCKALRAEAELYSYPHKDDEPFGEKPVKENDHAMDALRYLVMGVDKRRAAREQSEGSQ